MNFPPINFIQGLIALNQLANDIRKPQESANQRIRFALKAIEEIRVAFETAKSETIHYEAADFGQVATYLQKLSNIQCVITYPELPFFQPVVPGISEEPLPLEEVMRVNIYQVKAAIVSISINALNRQLEGLLTNLVQSAQQESSMIRDVVNEYSKCPVTPTDSRNVSFVVRDCLNNLQDDLIGSSNEVDTILESLTHVKIDRRYLAQEDLAKFKSLIDGFYSEFSKISNSLIYFAEQNNRFELELNYKSVVNTKMSIEEIEDKSPGVPREPLLVMDDYAKMVEGFTKDLKTLIKKSPNALINIINAYSLLGKYVESKDAYVEKENEFADGHIKRLEKKHLENQEKLSELQKRSPHFQQQINNLKKKVRYCEEACLDFKEDRGKFQKKVDNTVFSEAKTLLKDIANNEKYRQYVTRKVFEPPLHIGQDLWLTAPLRLHNMEEIIQTSQAFEIYDDAINDFRSALKNYKDCKAAVSPFVDLESKIMGTEETSITD